jgi:hypothetical protein
MQAHVRVEDCIGVGCADPIRIEGAVLGAAATETPDAEDPKRDAAAMLPALKLLLQSIERAR